LDSSVVSNALINLAWSPAEESDKISLYRLFLGTDLAQLSIIYEGTSSSFQIKELAYGNKYFWRVEAVNIYGVSSQSPLYSFITIPRVTRAFNYPNPFNPLQNQNTHIVFDMPANGVAEISIFTEFGDLCWSNAHSGLLKGANEISYNGKDGNNQPLYNCTYLCTITKKYGNREDKDRCRILILK
jgi:hypothetical protein